MARLPSRFFDEMTGTGSQSRQPFANYCNWLDRQDGEHLLQKSREAEGVFRRTGITFNVYGEDEATERLIPFDVIPRVISQEEWTRLERGIEQRVQAINAFIYDVYHRQEILEAGIVPTDLVVNNPAFVPEMVGFDPPGNIYAHIVGIDLVRTSEDSFAVLEDNARTPSGVSYMLENRETMLEMFPELFAEIRVQPVEDYPFHLRSALEACNPRSDGEPPTVGVLTPGLYNSAYFEHSFLAEQMGVELVEGRDLRVANGKLLMRTTQGEAPIDVLYRRVDDEFLDPLNFRADSQLGVPGLFDVYRSGALTLANAPGTGIADDKAIYSFMPDIIEFYTGTSPIIDNVETWRCSNPDSLAYVLDHLEELVVKKVDGSGGYGMLVGPTSSKQERQKFEKKLRENPAKYIAQPTLALSTVPILTNDGLSSRHVDLRPFVLASPNGIYVTPGGLTRVALTEGSLVVNSSQGGGTKDTWVLSN